MTKIQRYSIERDPAPWSDARLRPDDRGLLIYYSDHEAALEAERAAREPIPYTLTDAGRAEVEKRK